MIEHAKTAKQIKVINLDIKADNEILIARYQKLGVQQIENYKKAFLIDGVFYDEIIMNLYLE